MVSVRACSLMGSTIPVVPRMERPPTIPSLGLNVFWASASPSGAEMVTFSVPQNPASPAACRTASVIIFLGTLLMAGAPTGCSSPGFVTRPIPSPPSSTIRTGSESGSCRLSESFFTSAKTSIPWVISGSSPASFRTAHDTTSE